ncbi:DUF3131 domain-containing protein [Marimonas lutisalis]|uniref:DUF3131 domain-containing protein n=1 Tax=Marimonas lutisalis TaxID=2545756 RepID=UPI0010FA5180|nr:DUF3131 domain-containing protein [Marimonas lutisalis]
MMRRRSFLASTAALGVAGAVWGLPARAVDKIVSTALVITDISAQSDPTRIAAVAQRLLDRGVWLSCVIDLPETDDPDLAGVARALQGLGGGVEFAVNLPGLAGQSPYFQGRSVFEAKARLGLPVQSVLCEAQDTPQSPEGVRAAGVRNVLVRPGESAPVQSQNWPVGVARFFGGQWVVPGAMPDFGETAVGAENRVILYLSARALDTVPETRLTAWADDLGDELLAREAQGTIALMPVSDLSLRDDFGQERLVAVVLEEGGDTAQALRPLQEVLRGAGIPVTVKPEGTDFWVNAAGEGAGAIMPLQVACETGAPAGLRAAGAVGPGHALRLVAEDGSGLGPDGCGRLQVPVWRMQGDDLPMTGDMVLAIPADGAGTGLARRRIMAALEPLHADPVTRFVTLADFAEALRTKGTIETRHRLTQAAVAGAPEKATAWGEAERARLREDAAHAWGYFEKYTNAITGLSPATVDSGPGGIKHEAVTMWDAGSNINAIVAAFEIGLIDKARAEKRLATILPNISGRRTQGRLLPQGWIRTDRFHWGDWNFDGCDAGRLLAALDNARRRLGMGAALEKLVTSWDMEKIIVDGAIHSVTNRELVSTYASHCAHYAALAFRRWGYEVRSPYETFAEQASADGEVALLEAVSRIGPLGAEPLLLEAMELGMSPESGYLADVLHAAQVEEYAASGRLVCVSETPIDRSPWFIYQGLELGSGARSWRLDTVGHQPQYLTAEAAEDYLAFSSKAAFLWAAYRPGAHAARFLEKARSEARNEIGFASSVNLKRGAVTRDYTDLNTNAIILQAVAHVLRGRA